MVLTFKKGLNLPGDKPYSLVLTIPSPQKIINTFRGSAELAFLPGRLRGPRDCTREVSGGGRARPPRLLPDRRTPTPATQPGPEPWPAAPRTLCAPEPVGEGRDSPAAGRAHPPRYLVLGRRVRLAGRPLPQLRHAGHWRVRSPRASSAVAAAEGCSARAAGPGRQPATRLLALARPRPAPQPFTREPSAVSLPQLACPLAPPPQQMLGTSAHAHCRHLGPGDPPMARLHQGGVAKGAGRSRVERNALDSSLRGREGSAALT